MHVLSSIRFATIGKITGIRLFSRVLTVYDRSDDTDGLPGEFTSGPIANFNSFVMRLRNYAPKPYVYSYLIGLVKNNSLHPL